eukprot:IDg19337t1
MPAAARLHLSSPMSAPDWSDDRMFAEELLVESSADMDDVVMRIVQGWWQDLDEEEAAARASTRGFHG